MTDFPTIDMATINHWRDAGETFAHGEHSIFLRRGGKANAEPVVLLHGFPTSGLDWHPLWDALAEDHYLIAPDFLGFGFSDKPHPYEYSLVEQADIIDAILKSLNIENFHIFAHDYGVSVAQELLTRHGRAVMSCAFLNGGLLPEHHRARPIQTLLVGPDGPEIVKRMRREAFGPGFSEIFGPDTQPTEKELDAYWAVISENNGQRVQPSLLGYMAERREHADPWRKVLIEPPCPLAMINGTQDPVSGGHLADALNELNPDIAVTRLETIGHYPMIEAPNAVFDAYQDFRSGI